MDELKYQIRSVRPPMECGRNIAKPSSGFEAICAVRLFTIHLQPIKNLQGWSAGWSYAQN